MYVVYGRLLVAVLRVLKEVLAMLAVVIVAATTSVTATVVEFLKHPNK